MNEDKDFYSTLHRMMDAHITKKGKKDKGDLMGEISVSVRSYREQMNLTQDELASRLGVSRRQVERWEAMKSMPSNLARIKMRELGIRV